MPVTTANGSSTPWWRRAVHRNRSWPSSSPTPPDHLGSAESPQAAYGTPVYAHEAEVPRARRDFLQQVAVGQALRNSRRPGAPPRAPRSGGTAHVPVAAPGQVPRSGPPDLPGRPVPAHREPPKGAAERARGRALG